MVKCKLNIATHVIMISGAIKQLQFSFAHFLNKHLFEKLNYHYFEISLNVQNCKLGLNKKLIPIPIINNRREVLFIVYKML